MYLKVILHATEGSIPLTVLHLPSNRRAYKHSITPLNIDDEII